MPKFFIDPDAIEGSRVCINGEAAHHMLHVLRVGLGESILLCDGQQTDYDCLVEKIHPKGLSLSLSIQKTSVCRTEPGVQVVLYQAWPKSDKMDWIVQKCVELGIHEIVPVITTRTVARPGDLTAKTARYQRIAEAAAGQSMRGIIPRVHSLVKFEDALCFADPEVLWLVAYENEQHRTIKNVLNAGRAQSIGLWIGPEGGFTEAETEALRACRAEVVTLGRRILRTETAGMAALTQVLCVLEEC